MCACFENIKASKKSSELNDSFAAATCMEALPPKRTSTPALSSVPKFAINTFGQSGIPEDKKWQTNFNSDASGLNVANWKKFNVPRKVAGDQLLAKEVKIKEQVRSGSSASIRSNSLSINLGGSRPASAMDRPASSLDSIQSTLERLKEWCDQGLMDAEE
jgi:hypothetical protein